MKMTSSRSQLHHSRRRLGAAFAALVTGAVLFPQAPATAQINCQSGSGVEQWGPTDVNAVTGNGRLSVGVNPKATVTVFKWPSPSYYDQIKYRTTNRSQPLMGARPNEGALLGIAWKSASGDKGWQFSWLRDWSSTQRFGSALSDDVVTVFRRRGIGLKVKVHDVVLNARSALVREVTVQRTRRSSVRKARVFSFTNFNPVLTKLRNAPTADWCTEERNDDGARYVAARDMIVHERTGMDESTGASGSVVLASALVSRAKGFHVGPDTYQATRAGISAYDAATTGSLPGSESAAGQADAALFEELSLGRSRTARATAILAAGSDLAEVSRTIKAIRSKGAPQLRRAKANWWRKWLKGAAVPRNAPPVVARLARRALISIRQATDPSSGLIVTSVATQAPLGVDWVRQGAYINAALHEAGFTSMVNRHNRRYAALQAALTKPPGGETTPYANWSENFYGDGVVGGTRPYEIDSTGLGIWTLWEHYRRTRDRAYLHAVYPAVQRAAHYLSDNAPVGCRDQATGLQCSAYEDGSSNLRRTLQGAQTAWLGLGAAASAADAIGTAESATNAKKWRTRRDELGAAIRNNYFIEDCKCYTQDPRVGGTLLWPVRMLGKADAKRQADANWKSIRRAILGKESTGGLESRALLGNAHVWSSTAAGKKKLARALRWIAEETTTPGTRILGGAWTVLPSDQGGMTTMLSQPHVWNQAMFYLATLETWGKKKLP